MNANRPGIPTRQGEPVVNILSHFAKKQTGLGQTNPVAKVLRRTEQRMRAAQQVSNADGPRAPREGAGIDWTARTLPRLAKAARARMAGPGGYYNLGNALGLAMGIAVQLTSGSAVHGTATGALYDYFAGSGSALALTLATLVFFCSGESYHRAWVDPGASDQRLNRLGDLLSAVGAIGLGAALFLSGQPLLAATAGLMHAFGKFASAAHRPGVPLSLGLGSTWPAAWPDPFRSAVLASRLPAMLAAMLSIANALPGVWSGGQTLALAAPLTLLACYALWARADLMLFAGPGTASLNEA